MGFGASVSSMVTSATSTAAAFFADFWPYVAFLVGLFALGYIISIFINR